jgi:hypothetical protein
MAKILTLTQDDKEIEELIVRAFQSGNINFLLGSGASMPALSVSGPIESDITELFKNDKNSEANKKLYDFLTCLLPVNNALIDSSQLQKKESETDKEHKKRTEPIQSTKESYATFLANIEFILDRRRTNILRKHANIFTTNYDLFIEDVSHSFPAIRLNDGFHRTPSLQGNFLFSTQSFFNSITNCGNLYNYKVEIPSINLVKIHGSLSWKRFEKEITFEAKKREPLAEDPDDDLIKKFNDDFCLILPQQGKFRETLLDRWYYELLRIYSNELDKEGTVLVVFGFSFCDEHIHEITKRALKNPTLLCLLFAYDETAANSLSEKFVGHSNVIVIKPASSKTLAFESFNSTISDALKKKRNIPDEG